MIQSEKQRLRERMRKLSLEKPPGNTLPLLDALCGLDHWNRSSSILLYAPILSEPDPTSLLTESGGRSFLFPRMAGNHLEIYRMTSGSLWISGPFGIREPDPETWEPSSAEEVDLAVVPGMAFDLGGGRLGRGKGFYDRLLGDPQFRGVKIGLAWEWQIIDKVPRDDHDVPMDLLLTGGKLHDPGSMLDKPQKRG